VGLAVSAPPDPGPVPAPPGDDLPVLLVDDDGPNLLAIRSALERSGGIGREVRCARSGEEALGLLLEGDYALLLLDVELPGIDGFATAELVRGRDRTRDLPIVFLTAFPPGSARLGPGHRVRGAIFAYKPVAPEVLRAKVAAFLEIDRRRRLEALGVAEAPPLAP
jgi:CheY-like chemotaxis protein